MVNIFTSLVIFMLTILAHAGIFRLRVNHRHLFILTTGIFGVGFITNILTQSLFLKQLDYLLIVEWWTTELPMTSIFLFALVSAIYMLFFTNIYWGEESPSFAIYFLVKRYRKLTAAEIRTRFSDKKIIGSRLTDLFNERYVHKKGGRYLLTSRGKFVYSITEFYRKILNWQSGG